MEHFLNIVARSGVIYLVVLIGLRLLGKRHVAQLSIIDFVLILLISNAVQNAMVGDDTTLLGGIAAAATLLVINYILTLLLYKYGKLDYVFSGTPVLLIHDGTVIHEHLASEKITPDELEQVIREHGIETVGAVKNAVMELDGTISVIPYAGGEHRIQVFKNRRTKFHQRKTP